MARSERMRDRSQGSQSNMQLANSKARDGAVPQALHWLTTVFVICGFLLGRFGDVFPKGPARELGLLVPLLGLTVQLKRGNELPIFAVWHVESPWPVDRSLARSILSLHGTLADALLILAGIHACAALVHHWIWRDRTLSRMLPSARLAPQRAGRSRRRANS